jgi:general secretion pathway protein D
MNGKLSQIDPSLGLTRDDYRHMNAPKSGEDPMTVKIDKGVPPIPPLADILAAPRPPKIGESQIVSIAVTDDVPLKDVLLELAKLADVDIELDSGITGGISFIAKNKPFNEVIDRICDMAGLRYTMKDGVLRVERDTPYIKSYSIAFLNLDRDSDSSVSLSTNVLSSSVGGGSGGSGGSSGSSGGSGGGSGGSSSSGLNTGSTSDVKSKSSGDFWKSMEAAVQQILSYEAPQHLSDTVMEAENGGGAVSAAVRPASSSAASSASSSATAQKEYTINRQAGVLTVNATQKQHEMLERLIDKLKKNASAQVLIEAKIIEVTLNDQYQSGVDWSKVWKMLNRGAGIAGNFNSVGNALPTGTLNSATPSSNVVSFATSNGEDLLSMVETFGATRTLSSPRLHAINNQQSTMTFAVNQVYFQLSINTTTNLSTATTGAAASNTTVNSTILTVPIGIMMTMMPSIDLENNEVTLAVRPTLSTVTDTVADPAVAIEAAQAGITGVQNLIPEVQVRELDSTLKLKSGQTMVIGGLMQQSGTNTDTGVPFVAGIPYIGNLFKSVSKQTTNKELILLIKATIVNTNGSLNGTDANVFHKFSDDPRPVSF